MAADDEDTQAYDAEASREAFLEAEKKGDDTELPEHPQPTSEKPGPPKRTPANPAEVDLESYDPKAAIIILYYTLLHYWVYIPLLTLLFSTLAMEVHVLKRTDQRAKFDKKNKTKAKDAESAEPKSGRGRGGRGRGRKASAEGDEPQSGRGRGGRGRARKAAAEGDEPQSGRGRGRGRGRKASAEGDVAKSGGRGRGRGGKAAEGDEPNSGRGGGRGRGRKAEGAEPASKKPKHDDSEAEQDLKDSPHGRQTVRYSPVPAAKAPKGRGKGAGKKAQAKVAPKAAASSGEDDGSTSPPLKKVKRNLDVDLEKAKVSPPAGGEKAEKPSKGIGKEVSPAPEGKEKVSPPGERKTFASRRPPTGEAARARFEAIKGVFRQQVAPKFDWPSSWEVRGFSR